MPLPGDVDVRARLRADGSRPRGAARPGDAGPHHADRLDPPRLCHRREVGDGRRPWSTARAAGSRLPGRGAALHPLRHGRGRERSGSVISAVLFGALGGIGQLPFGREAFEATIARGGVGVERQPARLRRRRCGWPLAAAAAGRPRPRAPRRSPRAGTAMRTRPSTRCCSALREPVSAKPHARWLTEGVRRLIDYQDPAYAALYLDRWRAIGARRPRRTDGAKPRATSRCG